MIKIGLENWLGLSVPEGVVLLCSCCVNFEIVRVKMRS